MGHFSIELTMRYSQLYTDHKKRAVDILARRIDTGMTLKLKFEEVKEGMILVTV